jgi:hypothetical protein
MSTALGVSARAPLATNATADAAANASERRARRVATVSEDRPRTAGPSSGKLYDARSRPLAIVARRA